MKNHLDRRPTDSHDVCVVIFVSASSLVIDGRMLLLGFFFTLMIKKTGLNDEIRQKVLDPTRLFIFSL